MCWPQRRRRVEQLLASAGVEADWSGPPSAEVIRAGDTVAIEDPGYQNATAVFTAHGLALHGVPVDDDKRFVANLFAAGASITPVPGTDAGGAQHLGVGTGIEFTPRQGALHGMLSYGYSPTALRGGERGGHGVALSLEVNFDGPAKTPRLPTTVQQGMSWLVGPSAR